MVAPTATQNVMGVANNQPTNNAASQINNAASQLNNAAPQPNANLNTGGSNFLDIQSLGGMMMALMSKMDSILGQGSRPLVP